jgi:hypothetical protein
MELKPQIVIAFTPKTKRKCKRKRNQKMFLEDKYIKFKNIVNSMAKEGGYTLKIFLTEVILHLIPLREIILPVFMFLLVVLEQQQFQVFSKFKELLKFFLRSSSN